MVDLINKNNISFRCSYGGECMAEIEDCRICAHYVCDYEDIQNVDVITEQEIKNQTIDEFVANTEEWNNNIKSIRNEDGFFTIENIRDIAEQMKAGDSMREILFKAKRLDKIDWKEGGGKDE